MENLVGKFVNRRGWSDVNPVGKIIGMRGKTILVIKMVVETIQTQEMSFIRGGFAGHCTNMHDQKWEFEEVDNIFELRVSKQFSRQYMIEEAPRKFYDYNF
jgi:hypothetical protein